ncbi:MAG: methionine adenosyltransferase [Candidatus Poseidoniia archaeon]|nr:methionine adenosyltransferase [Candidatus Poseidoniia archaeon]|tara:strand:+ start:287 stop:1426 length:1140 start_codon:yes stop_codon:yes gene_type:complete
MGAKRIFTSESVTEGHPDKVSDRISDSVLDALLAGDKYSRVACETLTNTNLAVVAGEITSETNVDYEKVVRQAIREIGYTGQEMGYDCDNCEVRVHLDQQSPDISQGVTQGKGLHRDQGAGDQGMMFGFACGETPTLMPAPIYYAHRLTERLTEVRKKGIVDYFYPDGKSQVTLAYEGNTPTHADAIVIAQQHADDVEHDKIVEDIVEHVIKPTLPSELLDPLPEFHINATGRFVIGGPHGDCGLTGRKIIVDTYGGYAPHGGGAFSGKDPSKVDRSAAYAGRWVAKNVVAAGLAERCEVALAYSIGVANPVWINVKTFGTETESVESIRSKIESNFDLRPRAIIEDLDLLKPIYTDTSAYGHFGRENPDFTWEKTGQL